MVRANFMGVATLPADLVLHPLGGNDRTLDEQLKLFHLVAVVLDPYTYESSWILDTANRILTGFTNADCRTAWVVAADPEGTREFLGELADQHLVFCDPDREFIAATGVTELPAFVVIDLARTLVGAAGGWNPQEWQPIAEELAREMSWTSPAIIRTGDPAPFEGTPALAQ